METKFHVVEAAGNDSLIRCKQAQDLGIITVNINGSFCKVVFQTTLVTFTLLSVV